LIVYYLAKTLVMYPDIIREYSERVANLIGKDCATEEGLDPVELTNNLIESISEISFDKWIKTSDVILDEFEIINAINMAITICVLSSLKSKGLIDNIDNERGEEIWFPTKLGKDSFNKK